MSRIYSLQRALRTQQSLLRLSDGLPVRKLGQASWSSTTSSSSANTSKKINASGDIARRRASENFSTKYNSRFAGRESQEDGAQHSPYPHAAPISASSPIETTVPTDDSGPFQKLAELGINPLLLSKLSKDFKYHSLTPFQAVAIPTILGGGDVAAETRTGSGKTIAYLVPALHQLAAETSSDPDHKVSLLVICPTHKSCKKIAAVAEELLRCFSAGRDDTKYKVGQVVASTTGSDELGDCDVLVATPRPLLKSLRGNAKLRLSLDSLKTRVLVEADQLISIQRGEAVSQLAHIKEFLPGTRKSRPFQSLVFYDGTNSVKGAKISISTFVLRNLVKGFQTLITHQQNGKVSTQQKAPQRLVIVPEFSDAAAALVGVLRRKMAVLGKKSFKALVFVSTDPMASFYCSILSALDDLPEAHKYTGTQKERRHAVRQFNRLENGILIMSDEFVAKATGKSIPGIVHCIQVGVPESQGFINRRLELTTRSTAHGKGTVIGTQKELAFYPDYFPSAGFVPEESELNLAAHHSVTSAIQQMKETQRIAMFNSWVTSYALCVNHNKLPVSKAVRQDAITFGVHGFLLSPEDSWSITSKKLAHLVRVLGTRHLNLGLKHACAVRRVSSRGSEDSQIDGLSRAQDGLDALKDVEFEEPRPLRTGDVS